MKSSSAKLASTVHIWDQMTVTPTAKGERRDVFEGSSPALDLLHCHITTLRPGESSGDPTFHPQEEVIIVKEGLVEAYYDGQAKTGGPGSVIFFAAGANTRLRNAGTTPCTYIVVYYFTKEMPRS